MLNNNMTYAPGKDTHIKTFLTSFCCFLL